MANTQAPTPAEAFIVTCDDMDQWDNYPIAVFARSEAAQAHADSENATAKRKRRRQTYSVQPIEYHPAP